ncbi:MAG: hypothetical protein NT157_03080 [Candidatus Micrarchaeota archaeon]|nr:hypothetical protein [Candidatus Micrarchaeota archaeon]
MHALSRVSDCLRRIDGNLSGRRLKKEVGTLLADHVKRLEGLKMQNVKTEVVQRLSAMLQLKDYCHPLVYSVLSEKLNDPQALADFLRSERTNVDLLCRSKYTGEQLAVLGSLVRRLGKGGDLLLTYEEALLKNGERITAARHALNLFGLYGRLVTQELLLESLQKRQT